MPKLTRNKQAMIDAHAKAERLAFICPHKTTVRGLWSEFPLFDVCVACGNAWPPYHVKKLPGTTLAAGFGIKIAERTGPTHLCIQGERVMEVFDTGKRQTIIQLPARKFVIAGVEHDVFDCWCNEHFCSCGRPMHMTPEYDGFIQTCHHCNEEDLRWLK